MALCHERHNQGVYTEVLLTGVVKGKKKVQDLGAQLNRKVKGGTSCEATREKRWGITNLSIHSDDFTFSLIIHVMCLCFFFLKIHHH